MVRYNNQAPFGRNLFKVALIKLERDTHLFEDAILVPEARDLTTFAALENYALRLGNMRLMGNAAIGFHIENAEALFQSLGRVQFIDVLVDAADAIALALKSSRHILAHSV